MLHDDVSFYAKTVGFAAAEILARRGAVALVNWADSSRLKPEQIDVEMSRYPDKFTVPGEGVFSKMHITTKGVDSSECIVNIPLWSVNQCATDLELVIVIKVTDGKPWVSIWDMYVP